MRRVGALLTTGATRTIAAAPVAAKNPRLLNSIINPPVANDSHVRIEIAIATVGVPRLATHMKNDPRLTALAASLPDTVPFVGPETQERAANRPFDARLGANELGFGPSPKAISAMQSAAIDAWMYADPENHDLKMALAAHHSVSPDNIAIDAGIDTLLGILVRLLVDAGTDVVTSAGAYPTFNYHVAGFGGVLHQVPYIDDHEDPAALLEKVKQTGAKLVYLANPDNPMGTLQSAGSVEHMVEQLPNDCLLILDEAYGEFAPSGDLPTIQVDDPRIIRMRTFSKAYGLAGARLGYALGHTDLIRSFNKVRNHFGMCRISQAGALAALEDQEYLEQTLEKVAISKETIASIARDNGLMPLPSATNFVAIDCGGDGAFARAIVTELAKRRIFIRMPFVAPQDRCIRISCGPQDELDALAAALPAALAAARARISI